MSDGPYRVEIQTVRSHLFRREEVQYRWNGLCKTLVARPPSIPKVFFSRNSGGLSVMICAPISANEKTYLAFIENTMDSKRYKTVLEHFLLLFPI